MKVYRWLVVTVVTVLVGGAGWTIYSECTPPPQAFDAQDQAPAAGDPTKLSSLEPVAMVEMVGAGPVTYTTSSHIFAARLQLTLPAETKEGKFSVSTAMLAQTLGGNSVPLLVSDGNGPKQTADFEVGPAKRVVEIHLKATLGAPGDYIGALVLRHGTAVPQAKTIVVKYTHADLPIAVTEARKLPGACFPSMNLQQALSVTVTGPPGGDQLTVVPTVASLKVSSESTQAAVGAVYRSVTFHMPAGAARAPATSTSMFQVKPGLPTKIGFAFDGIEGPGSYAGRLQFSAQGYKPIFTDFTFAIRYSWMVALLMVTLGAGVITLVRRAVVDVQPRLVIRAAVARLLTGHDSLNIQLHPVESESVILTSIKNRIVSEREKANQSQPPAEAAVTESLTVLNAYSGDRDR